MYDKIRKNYIREYFTMKTHAGRHEEETSLGVGAQHAVDWEKPTEIANIIERLKSAGKLGNEVSDLILLISDRAVHFATLDKPQYIEYLYASTIRVQALFELYLTQTRKGEQSKTIRNITTQLGQLDLFCDQLAIECFAHQAIQGKIERLRVVIHSLSAKTNLRRKAFLESMGYTPKSK